jgi:hypothetical protein
MNFVYLRSSRLHFFQIWALIHALATRGRKEGGEKLHCIPGTYPKSQGGACAFLLHFWLLGVWSAVWNRPDQFWKLVWPVLVEPAWPVMGTGLTGLCPGLALAQGELAYVQGSSCVLWWFVLFAWAWFCLGCVEPLPLPKGSEILQVILFFAFLGFRSLVGVFFLFVFFSIFLLLFVYQMCVLSMHSSRGRLRTMCGSRTGGWSLPCVMSDWQRCVDW